MSSADRGQRRRVQFVCDFYVPEVHAGVVDYARAADWSLQDGSVYVPGMLFKYQEECDGIVAIFTQDALGDWLKAQTCPVVRMLHSVQESPFPSVEPDCEVIATRGAEHLLTLGSPTFAFYRVMETSETRKMWEAFSRSMQRAGRKAHLLDFGASLPAPPTFTTPRQARWEYLHRALQALPLPLAVMAEDDRFAYDLIEAAQLGGWRIPEDLAVLAADNRELILGKFPIPLSSVDSNLRGVGWAGAALLDWILMGGEPPPEPVRVRAGEVVARQSTASFTCGNPGVTAAVNFLRSRYHEPIQVSDVARAAGLSSRSIQTAFRQIVGCTISDELSRLRLANAVRLLRETDLKLDSVAHESGLTSAKYLCDVFRAAFDCTPTEYRAQQRLGATKGPAQNRTQRVPPAP